MNWQPIDTGPKDGTLYLLYAKSGVMFVGKFSKHLGLWLDQYGDLKHANHDLTHWAPLPAPPTETK